MVLLTELLYGIYPICVLVIVVVDVVVLVLGVLELRNLLVPTILRVEERLLHIHGVFVAIEHTIACWLPCTCKLVVERHARLSAFTALELDFDYTV